MDLNAVGAIFVGLSAIITAIGGLLTVRARRASSDARELRLLREAYRLAIRHIFQLEILLESKGIEAPRQPDGIDVYGEGET